MNKTPNQPSNPQSEPTPREIPTREYPNPNTNSPSDPQDNPQE